MGCISAAAEQGVPCQKIHRPQPVRSAVSQCISSLSKLAAGSLDASNAMGSIQRGCRHTGRMTDKLQPPNCTDFIDSNRQTRRQKRCQTLLRRQKKSCESHRHLALTALRLARIISASLRDIQTAVRSRASTIRRTCRICGKLSHHQAGAAPSRSPNVPR